jgi:hypothetical protein
VGPEDPGEALDERREEPVAGVGRRTFDDGSQRRRFVEGVERRVGVGHGPKA